jgi:hypothetical protein
MDEQETVADLKLVAVLGQPPQVRTMSDQWP